MNQGNYRSSSTALKNFHEQLLCKNKQKKKPKKEPNDHRLPSIYHTHNEDVRDQQRNRLHKKIQQMEKRLQQYQQENQIENQVKERFEKMMEKYSSHHQMGFRTPQYLPNYHQPLQLIYTGGQYPPIGSPPMGQPPMNSPYMGSPPMRNNPSLYNSPPLKQNPSRSVYRKKLIRKLRVAVIAVLFCQIFPRYSRKVTQIRYQKFKDRTKLESPLLLKQKLFKFLSEEIKKIINKNNQQLFNKSKYMSFKNDGSDSLTVFMHLESVIKYEQEIIEELIILFRSEMFTKFVEYFSYSLPYQFMPNFIFTQKQVSHLNIHPKKGYSRAPKQTSKYLILQKLFQEMITSTNLIVVVEEQLKAENQQTITETDNIQFSLKQQMFKILIQNYSSTLQNSLRKYLLSNNQIAPGFKQKKHQLNIKPSQIQKDHMSTNEIDTDQFDEQQVQLAKQFNNALQKSIEIIYDRAHKISYHHLKQAKNQALQQSLNKIGGDQIYIRSHNSLEQPTNEVSEISQDSEEGNSSSEESSDDLSASNHSLKIRMADSKRK